MPQRRPKLSPRRRLLSPRKRLLPPKRSTFPKYKLTLPKRRSTLPKSALPLLIRVIKNTKVLFISCRFKIIRLLSSFYINLMNMSFTITFNKSS